MHKSATKCNETIGKWCKNKHGASKIIDTFETYHRGVVEFAWLVKRSIEGVLALFAPLTAAGSPRASLVRRRSL
jgi:hypothetical protein